MKCILVLVVLLIVNYAVAGEYYKVNNTKYYISHPMSKNYHQAFRYCAINGMHLVSIHTQENHNSVLAAINDWNSSYPNVHFWTSGTSLGHLDKEFYWAETGFPITFTNWISGAPSSVDRKCIILHGGATHKYNWYDQGCLIEHAFICEDKIKLPVTVQDYQCEYK